MKSVSDLGDLRGKRVLIRCDFNVPLDGTTITDDGRIRAALPTLTQLKDAGAKVVVMAHLGRPKGKVDPTYSLAPAAARLGELLGTEVKLAGDVVGAGAQALVAALQDGEIALLENVRYEPAEESKVDAEREELAAKYAALGDVFVSDGFGVVHRKQASVYDVAKLLPNAAGSLVAKEVDVLKKLTEHAVHPYVVVLGGAKVADKLAVIDNLLKVADTLIIGGGMAYTFLKGKGYEIGGSLLDAEKIDACAGYLEQATAAGKQILLPVRRARRRGLRHPGPYLHRGDHRRRRRDPCRPGGCRHRAEVRGAVRRGHPWCGDDLLERADGCRGDPRARRRHRRRRQGPGSLRRLLRCRGWRLRSRRPQPRFRR